MNVIGTPSEQSLRVLLVTKGLDIGGIERIVSDLAVALGEREIDAEVAVVNGRRRELAGRLGAAGTVVHWLNGTDLIGLRGLCQLAALVSDRRYDVVHVHGPLPAIAARLVPACRPLVTTSHTPFGSLHPLTRMAWILTARRDAVTVAVSAVVAASLPRRIQRRTTVIPHGIDPAVVATAAGQPEERSPQGIVAVVVASHREVKNYPNLLRAIRVARRGGASLRVVAVGAGPRLTAHREMATALGINDIVEFRDPQPDVLTIIASADLLVVASDFEGQPLVVAEALALGRPVVATAVGRVPELVTPDVGRVVPPNDPEALGGAIAELAADEGLRRQMGRAAAQSARGWTLMDAVEAHLNVYRSVGRG